MSRRLIVAALILVAGLPLLAQKGPDDDPDAVPGYVKSIFHHSEVDSINLYNGNLTIPIPMGPAYPIGPKLKFQAMLTYNSRISEPGHPYPPRPDLRYMPFSGDPALGAGWSFRVGKIGFCGGQGDCFFRWDGAEINLSTQPAQYHLEHPNGPNTAPEMWDGDGNHYVFGWQVTGFDDDPPSNYTHDFGRGRNGWYLTSLSDPFGNTMNVSYYTNIATPRWSYGDTSACSGGSAADQTMLAPPQAVQTWLPRAISLPTGEISIKLDARGRIQTFTFPVHVNGQPSPATWTLGYLPGGQPFGRFCGADPGPHFFDTYLEEIALLQLPADIGGAPAYRFSYGGALLTEMTLPTGATINYERGLWSFYHGRVNVLSLNCNPLPVPPDAPVEVAAAPSSSGSQLQSQVMPLLPKGNCADDDKTRYLDTQFGIVKRSETVTVGGIAADTLYTQYSFPFGEQGAWGNNRGAQTLTVVLTPPDVDGNRRAKSVLFWSGPAGNAIQTSGDRTGSDIREATYDSDPNPASAISQPACGGATDYPFCANKAVRVTLRTHEYDTCSVEIGSCANNPLLNRRLKSETTYYGTTAADGTCSSCPYRALTYSELPGRTWNGNGQHYNIETISGNLGNDNRTTTTYWTPSTAPWFPNLLDKRITTDATGSLNQYFDYDHTAQANGFLRGTLTWDSGRSLLFADCRYTKTSQGVVDTHGNVASRYTGTFAWPPPEPGPNACFTLRPDPASWAGSPGNGDIFATDFTYQNGQRVSARAVNGPAQGGWLKYDVTRDSKTGWITSSRDTAGLQTSYLYDSLGRPTSITAPGETVTAVSYPSPVQTIATRNGGPGLSTYEEYDYDGLGRTVRERRLMPGSRYAKRYTKFDPAGNDYFKSEWVDDATAETVSANLQTSCSFPGGSLSTFRPTSAPGTYRLCYDPFGRPQQAVGSMHSSLQTISRVDGSAFYSDTQEAATTACVHGTYSGGSCSGGTDSTTAIRADAFGRITSVTEPGGDVTSYGYDVNGKLTSVAQGAQTRTFLYDRFGFLRSETTPEKGTITYDTIGSLGNVLQQTEPGNLVLSRSFDYAGRLTSVSSNEGRTYVANTYDEPSRGSSLGKLTTSVSTNYPPSGQSTVTDSFWYAGTGGRLSTKTTAVSTGGLPQLTESFYYNSLGLMSGHVHPRPETPNTLPFVVATEYDQGLPVRQYLNGLQLVKSVSYQPSGALAGYTNGLGIGFDVVTTVEPDGVLPRPRKIYATLGNGTKPFNLDSYSYDGTGNISVIGADTFGYDSRSRLVSASYPSNGSQQFSYDRFGNMNSRTGVNAQSFTVDAATNHVAGYDYLRGNLMGPAGWVSYTWDGLDRMASQTFGSWTYLYNAENERIGKQSQAAGWTFTLRDLDKRVSTEFAGSTPSRDNVFLGNLLVASYANTSVGGNTSPWSFYSPDHLGTPRFVAHIDVPDSESHKFWPYGEEVQPQTAPQRLRFAAMERDDESSRFYDHARHHDFGFARFLGPDQLSGHVGDAQSWNRYAYSRNNPLKYVDPDGRVVRLSEEAAQASVDYRNQKRTFDGLVNAQTMSANWSNGNYWFEVATATANTFLTDPTLAMLPSPMALEVPGEASLLKFASGNFRQNLMRSLGKSVEEVAGRDAHHMLSQAERLAEQFSKAGLNIHDPKFGAFWDHAVHLRKSSQFNADWTAFLKKDRTAEDIHKYARVLAVKYDIPWR